MFTKLGTDAPPIRIVVVPRRPAEPLPKVVPIPVEEPLPERRPSPSREPAPVAPLR